MPRVWWISFVAMACFGQTPPGTIEGVVAGSSGISLGHIKVSAAVAGAVAAATETDGSGAYRLAGLAPGVYAVTVEAAGFTTERRAGVIVAAGRATRMDAITLLPGTKSADSGEVVRVPVIDPERIQQADTILQRQLSDLPINRRDYLNLAALTPAVSQVNDYLGITDAPLIQAPQSGLSFGGNNGRGNIFWLDGGENYINTGGVRPSISQEAVAEFHIVRSNYSAEFGGGIGGIVNIVSRAGGNDLHGNLFGFLRHRSVQARNYFDPGKGAFTRTQTGATLGGPVRKDRTYFFAAFERLQRQETSFVPILRDRSIFSRLSPSQQQLVDFLDASGIPSLKSLASISRQGLLTTTFPQTMALFDANSGVFPFSEGNALGSLRLDLALSDNHRSFLRFNAGNSNSQNDSVEGLNGFNRGRVADSSDRTVMLNDTRVLSANLVSESRLSLSRYRHNTANRDRVGPSLEINGFGYFGKESALPAALHEVHGQAQQNLFYTTGRHSLRFGADINPVRAAASLQANIGGRFFFGEYLPLGQLYNQFTGDPNAAASLAATLTALGGARLIPAINAPITSLQAFNLGVPSFYVQGFGDPAFSLWTNRFNFFVNDVVRLGPHVTFNAGLRAEVESEAKVFGTGFDLAPRIGLAWSPGVSRKTVIRAGWGLFYLNSNTQTGGAVEIQSGRRYNQVILPIAGLPGSRNPATGQALTSADVYQTLLAQGVIGKRAIEARDLAQFGVVPGPNFPFQVLVLPIRDWRRGSAQQASLEVERAIGGVAVSAAYNFTRAAHLPRLRDTNLKYGPPGEHGESTFLLVNPLVSQLLAVESAANSFFHALILQVSRRVERRVVLNAHYTFSKSIDEATDLHFLPNDSLNARQDRALSTFDQRHRVVASAVADLPGGFVLSPVLVVSSGRPFNILIGQDPNTRPWGAGRNLGHGPNFANADLRISRRFRLGANGSRRLEAIAEGFNLVNHTNFRRLNNVVGQTPLRQLPHPLIGRRGNPTDSLSFLAAFDPRQFQFALKVHF